MVFWAEAHRTGAPVCWSPLTIKEPDDKLEGAEFVVVMAA